MEATSDALELPRARPTAHAVQDHGPAVEAPPLPREAADNYIYRTSSSRRVKRTYLSMIAMAYALTIVSPGTSLWPSSSCSLRSASDTTPGNATTTIHPSGRHSSAPSTGECAMYGRSIGLLVLSKLTCWTLALVGLFCNLQGSDPGLLTKEVMRKLDAWEEDATISNGSDCNGNGEEADLERQGFLDPNPIVSTNGASLPHSIQEGNQKLYPHTRRKHCDKCHVCPPLRSHHCSDCGICVATFDHHCHFLGTCIGERNHFRFWLFLLLNVICSRMALGIVGTARLPQGTVDGVKWLEGGRAILVLAKVYMYPIYLAATLLWMIHTALAVGSVTTFEFAKGSNIDYLSGTSMTDFPFSCGLCGNLRTFISRDDASQWRKGFCKASWVPIIWKMPEFIDREAEDWWNHPYQNKYWNCC